MTCAHVVNVALKKTPGVEAVDVSLNKGLATVKLKSGNNVTVRQLWKLIQDNGYTPKTTTVLARGELVNATQFKISGTGEIFPLSNYPDAGNRAGQTVTIRGSIEPAKDLKALVPLRVSEVR